MSIHISVLRMIICVLICNFLTGCAESRADREGYIPVAYYHAWHDPTIDFMIQFISEEFDESKLLQPDRSRPAYLIIPLQRKRTLYVEPWEYGRIYHRLLEVKEQENLYITLVDKKEAQDLLKLYESNNPEGPS